MPTNMYKLVCSPLTGQVYISKVKNNAMLDDRKEVDLQEFMECIATFTKAKGGANALTVNDKEGKPLITIKYHSND